MALGKQGVTDNEEAKHRGKRDGAGGADGKKK